MKQTNFFLGLLLSFFSPKFYREVASSWRGRVYLALLIILFLFWAVLAMMGVYRGFKMGHRYLNEVASQMPVLTIKNGVASTTTVKPTNIYIRASKTPFVVIDTHSQLTTLNETKAMIIVQQKRVLVKKQGGLFKQYAISKTYKGHFGSIELVKMGSHLLLLLVPAIGLLVALIGFGLSYGICLLVSLILSLVGLIFAMLFKREGGFSVIFHMTLMCWVPVMAITLVLVSFAVYSFWAYFIFFLAYMFYGLAMLPRKILV